MDIKPKIELFRDAPPTSQSALPANGASRPRFETICVLGLGYIGLPTATMFAARQRRVIGVDINPRAVETINRGEIHIVEPDLDVAVHTAVHNGFLRASIAPEPADAFLIAVPTPFQGDNHEPDLSYVKAACEAVAPVLARGNTVVLESTSPVGTTEQVAGWLAALRPDLAFQAAMAAPQIYASLTAPSAFCRAGSCRSSSVTTE